jgi:hypothetical protein|tara:strand:+ start:211 stop:708 length:498 start_codon:yes stop_codon:yes gene_type:complete
MAISTYTPLMHEVFEKVAKLKSKKEKVSYLRDNASEAIRMVCKASFDPNIKWQLPEGDVPFTENDAPEGTEHGILTQEVRKFYHFIEGGNPSLTQNKREMMFVQMLENLHADEAQLVVSCKNKSLHRRYKGLSDNVVKEAFDWNDDYKRVEHEQYPQAKGMASGG